MKRLAETSVSLPDPDGVLQVENVHQRYFRTLVALSLSQVKNVVPPLDIIQVLNAEGVKFVLVSAHAGGLVCRRARAVG